MDPTGGSMFVWQWFWFDRIFYFLPALSKIINNITPHQIPNKFTCFHKLKWLEFFRENLNIVSNISLWVIFTKFICSFAKLRQVIIHFEWRKINKRIKSNQIKTFIPGNVKAARRSHGFSSKNEENLISTWYLTFFKNLSSSCLLELFMSPIISLFLQRDK